jgi:hypothetical protein
MNSVRLTDTADRERADRITGFMVAAAAAPVITLIVALAFSLAASCCGPTTLSTNLLEVVGRVLLGVVIIASAALAFGFLGSAALLGLTFSALALHKRHRGSLTMQHFVVAGMAAGVLHVALAWLSIGTAGPTIGTAGHTIGTAGPTGFGGILGTWFVRAALEKHSMGIAFVPPLAGAASGLIYACITARQRVRN